MKRTLLIAILATAPIAPALASATPPSLDDFAYGLTLTSNADKPLQELAVPDAVYAGVTRADLGDIRIFNATGVAVPYTICPASKPAAGVVQKMSVPIYAVSEGGNSDALHSRIDLETAQGTRVQIQEHSDQARESDTPAKTQAGKAQAAAYVIDLRHVDGQVGAINLNWETTPDTSEVQVRLQASSDLQHWRNISQRQTLLRAQGKAGLLERKRIPLSAGRYQYLRLERSDKDSSLRITSVTAQVVTPGTRVKATELPTQLLQADTNASKTFVYDTGHLAPARTAQVKLPLENMSLQVRLESRPTRAAAWRKRWQGEVDSVAGLSDQGQRSPVRFFPTTDRYWKLSVMKGRDSLLGEPKLVLAYHPQRLRFLAQGAGPYTLAFGSGRVAPAAQACGQLLSRSTPEKLATLTGQANISGKQKILGGVGVLAPAPEPKSYWSYVLWAVLIAGTILLLAMAFSLLRRIRQE